MKPQHDRPTNATRAGTESMSGIRHLRASGGESAVR